MKNSWEKDFLSDIEKNDINQSQKTENCRIKLLLKFIYYLLFILCSYYFWMNYSYLVPYYTEKFHGSDTLFNALSFGETMVEHYLSAAKFVLIYLIDLIAFLSLPFFISEMLQKAYRNLVRSFQ